MKSMWVILMLVAVGLAGCTGGDGPAVSDGAVAGDVDQETFELEVGKGAIEGLLVDDRFRPIHLTDDPETEFQRDGFILLQETGQQVQTDENGQFAFVDIEPGRYTLRVTAEGHEAVPAKVNVDEGLFSEVQILARRTVSSGSTIITQETVMFVACPVDVLVISYANPEGCFADLSGDSGRFDFFTNLTVFGDDIRHLVTEFLFNRDGWNDVIIREFESGDCPTSTLGDCMYAEAVTQDSDYIKFLNTPGEVNDQYDPPRNLAFRTDLEFQTAIFPHPDSYGTLRPVAAVVDPPLAETGRSIRGVGPALAVEAKVIQSIFLGEPDVDVEAYCLLC